MAGDRQEQINALHALAARDRTVKQMVQGVLAAEDLDYWELADQKPEVFDELYEAAFEMAEQLGDDTYRNDL